MAENECKHANAQGKKYCPDCGKQLVDESMERLGTLIEQSVEAALERRGMKKKEEKKDDKTDDDDEPKTELDRILGKGKKKK